MRGGHLRATPINCVVVDLSHYDTVTSYDSLKSGGIIGVVYKATQGQSYTDSTYKSAKQKALAAGLLWGAYHFGDNSNVDKQVSNFLNFAQPSADELICLDFEDYSSSQMSESAAKSWLQKVEAQLGRINQGVLYSGNTIKDDLGNRNDSFWGAHRLWLAQYGSTPNVQASWQTYWLWQYTDGTTGPQPHTVNGVQGGCDCNSYAGTAAQLQSSWSGGSNPPPPPPPPTNDLIVTVNSPKGVKIVVNQS